MPALDASQTASATTLAMPMVATAERSRRPTMLDENHVVMPMPQTSSNATMVIAVMTPDTVDRAAPGK